MTSLRLTTWNASQGRLEEKLEALSALRADIVLLQEVLRPRKPIPGLGWYGRAEGGKGVAVYSDTVAVRPLRTNGRAPWSIPAFQLPDLAVKLVAVWTRAETAYVAGLHQALDRHRVEAADSPVMVVGDFNANLRFGHEGTLRSFSGLAGRLEHTLGLRSAYHAHFGEGYGGESRPTHWFRWDRTQPFHIDYVFAPRQWPITQVDVGTYKEWRPLSDHAPLTAEFEITA